MDTLSTLPSTSQEFGNNHDSPGSPSNKMKEIEALEAKLAALRLGLSSRKPNQTPEKSPTPKVMPPQKVPATPNDGVISKPTVVGDCSTILVGEGHTMESPNLNMVALQRIANLPDGDCKSALMAMCEAQMTQVDIETINKLY